MVVGRTPKQEHALEYLTAPEQGLAYAGIVGARFAMTDGAGVIVVVVKIVVAEGVTVVARKAAQSAFALAT
jgi:hypothetical protein